MVWGRARSLETGMHWFDKDRNSLCKDRNGRHLKLRWPRPAWDPGGPGCPPTPETCPKCKILREDEIAMEANGNGK